MFEWLLKQKQYIKQINPITVVYLKTYKCCINNRQKQVSPNEEHHSCSKLTKECVHSQQWKLKTHIHWSLKEASVGLTVLCSTRWLTCLLTFGRRQCFPNTMRLNLSWLDYNSVRLQWICISSLLHNGYYANNHESMSH